MFLRPCFLVVDREFAGSISSRKLVIETAKFNVITSYSFEEGLATLQRFPLMHGVVVTADQRGKATAFLIAVRQLHPHIKLVLTGELPSADTPYDSCVPSFAPDRLLEALRDLFPADSATASRIEEKLEKDAGLA